MKKKLISALIGLFLLTGCSSTNREQIKIYKPELPEILKIGTSYGSFIDGNGDLYTWGYDTRNAGVRTAFYAGNSLGQGTEVIYNNTPTKINSGMAYVLLGNRGLSNRGEIIEWGKRMENDSCVPLAVKQGIVKTDLALYLTQNGELYTIPESDNTVLSGSYENSSELVMAGVKDFSIGNKYYALKNDGSVWVFQAGSMTAKIVEKPKKLIDDVEKIITSPATDSATLFIKKDGTLWSYGGNEYGQCGNGEHGDLNPQQADCVVSEPYRLAENVTDAWMTTSTTFYLTGEHQLYACGQNLMNLFLLNGNGPGLSGDYPQFKDTPILLMENVRQMECSDMTMYVLKTDNTLWVWGYADKGFMGNGVSYEGSDLSNNNFTMRLMQTNEALFSQPTQIMENVKRLFTETTGLHFVQKLDGSIWYWGYGEIYVDEDDDWDTKIQNNNLEGNVISAYQMHYIIPTPIEFSVDTFFQNALDSIAAREGIDTAQYQAVRYINEQ